ncbi:MAG: hypothetical protein US30_C0009G0029 [Candidatus Moranbacteria bacterium GW2011_GWF2_36_839]|nr:MAG: hypothetical protein US27_C0009G0029 [Candidatus Moranbacteria bacterium GW2011_GWF1_36_78]KKQ16936.1 MAG: hypothetical protein US30_C0009G0029 [Candidatus Moranbacteria bacterium GW2011_GWF2_36_839]HAT73630.1 hypothetical protein [Candidatus Moranbacteria bacterium]HBY10475.1 hypothetical protein [Candidatus Moranbacteria bacterium]
MKIKRRLVAVDNHEIKKRVMHRFHSEGFFNYDQVTNEKTDKIEGENKGYLYIIEFAENFEMAVELMNKNLYETISIILNSPEQNELLAKEAHSQALPWQTIIVNKETQEILFQDFMGAKGSFKYSALSSLLGTILSNVFIWGQGGAVRRSREYLFSEGGIPAVKSVMSKVWRW